MNRGTDYGRWQSCSILSGRQTSPALSHGTVVRGRKEWLPQSEIVPSPRF
jgi:hypothetical protein